MNKKMILRIMSTIILCSILGYSLPVCAYTKDETVYSKLDSSGNNYKTIVSTHIQNTEKQDVIKDISDLLNIKNTSGDETYTQDGSTFIWNINKKDIYYQGDSCKQLPVECNVKYELDGKEITADEIAGKSGKVKIILQYINKEERIVNINGKKEKMYVPFVVVAGTVLENENNQNISVSNGKIIDDGTKTIIVGMAMPGLQESLGVSKKDLEIPNSIEITMETTDFKSDSIISYITPKVLEDDDLSIFDKLDELYSQVGILQSSSQKIENGAKDLEDGTVELVLGSNQLKTGVDTLYNGAEKINSEIAKSTKALQSDKTEALDEETLKIIKEQAANGAKLTDKQKTQIIEQSKVNSILTDKQKTQITEQAKKNSVLTDAQKLQITEQAKKSAVLTEKQKSQITEKAKNSAKISESQKNAIIANAESSIKKQQGFEQLTVEEQKLLITTAKNVALQTAQTTATQTAVTVALTTAQETATQVAVQTALTTAQQIATQTAVQTALTTAQQIATQTARTTAVETAQTIATTTAVQTSETIAKQVGNQAKKTFTNQVVSQMNTLEGGLKQLTQGLSQLNKGASDLVDGTNQLNYGAKTLSDGIKTFNKQGIEKICNYMNTNVKDLSNRIEKLTELSKQYNNFTGLNEGNDGNVKFIMIIDAVKKQQQNENGKQKAIIQNNDISEKQE